jgi:homoserine O-acetyltransferase
MDMFDLGETFGDLHTALGRVKCPTMVIGVQTDILFPVWQQRELANILQEAGNIRMSKPDRSALISVCTGNHAVTYYELNSIYGHDTFLLDLSGVGAGMKVDLSHSIWACFHKHL